MKTILNFLLHFAGWTIGLPILVCIVFAPLVLALHYNNGWYLLIYCPILGFGLALKTFDE